jgi:uncharacterized protein YjbI with pentapeptide repeats
MKSRRSAASAVGLVAALGVITAIGLPATAFAAPAAVTCPTVNDTTGAVTPAPSAGVDWSGCDLDNAIMSGADLAGANLSGAQITGESRQEELAGTNLAGANLSNATMDGADMTGANLTNADMNSTNLMGAVLSKANVSGADLTNATLTLVESVAGGITGTPAVLPANWAIDGGFLVGPVAYLENADLAGVSLSGADLASAYLDTTNLTGTDLSGANLSAANIEWANLSNANLSNANLTGAFLDPAQLPGVNLTGTQLSGADLAGITSGDITGTAASLPANWTQAAGYLVGPNDVLTGADLAGASLPTADMQSDALTDADLAGTDLSGANLEDAVLTGANVTGTDLSGATLIEVHSGSLTGTPASLPADWSAVDGYLIGPKAWLTSAGLAGADLAGADLAGAYMDSANLTSANLAGATVTATYLVYANLTDANLASANLTGSYLDKANVSGAEMGTATLTGVQSGLMTGTPASLPADWSVVNGYLVGPGADLRGAALTSQNLAGADLDGTNLGSADLINTSLADANLTNADLDFARLNGASLKGATVTGATFSNTIWYNTTCPDGTNSNAYDDGCFSPLDTTPPQASPAVTAGTLGANGWYTSPVTVTWNWTDAGTIVQSDCQEITGTTTYGVLTLTASCEDLAGNVGHATFTVKVDTTAPIVMVASVTSGARYITGNVPVPSCDTTDTGSGVATAAHLTVTTTGANGVGPFTATCSGATSVAGTAQAAPVTAKYTVVYGFGGFSGLRSGAVIGRSARTITVRFRLTNALGKDISAGTTAAFAARHAVEVTLTGPSIKTVTSGCRWDSRAQALECTIKIPAKVRTGSRNRYKITAEENVGTGFVLAPRTGRAVNPLTITFASGRR